MQPKALHPYVVVPSEGYALGRISTPVRKRLRFSSTRKRSATEVLLNSISSRTLDKLISNEKGRLEICRTLFYSGVGVPKLVLNTPILDQVQPGSDLLFLIECPVYCVSTHAACTDCVNSRSLESCSDDGNSCTANADCCSSTCTNGTCGKNIPPSMPNIMQLKLIDVGLLRSVLTFCSRCLFVFCSMFAVSISATLTDH